MSDRNARIAKGPCAMVETNREHMQRKCWRISCGVAMAEDDRRKQQPAILQSQKQGSEESGTKKMSCKD